MGKADDFIKKVTETNYPPKTYFTGGYMPESDEEEDGLDKPKKSKIPAKKTEGRDEKAREFMNVAEDFLGEDFSLVC